MLAALIVLAVSIIVIGLMIVQMLLDAREVTVEEPTVVPHEHLGPMSVGTISRRMDVPRKHPLLRTRHSKSLP